MVNDFAVDTSAAGAAGATTSVLFSGPPQPVVDGA